MKRRILQAWETVVSELALITPRIDALGAAWFADIKSEFLLGWFKPVRSPYQFWFLDRLAQLMGDMFDLITGFLSVLPAVIVANIAIDQLEIDPKLRQRVMPLDEVALFPVKVILDQGIRAFVQGGYPTELRVADAGQKVEKLFTLAETGRLKTLQKILFGSVWGRIVKIAFLLVKFGTVFAYVILLLNYLKILENRNTAGSLFSAQLSNRNPRKNERIKIRRRVGGVLP